MGIHSTLLHVDDACGSYPNHKDNHMEPLVNYGILLLLVK